MIVAIGNPPPASARRVKPRTVMNMMRGVREIFNRHGFLTYPGFVDNNYILRGEADVKYLRDHAELWGDGLIRFAILPDNMPEEAHELIKDYPDIDWIWPLHDINDSLDNYLWIGFPHIAERRNYTMGQFLEATEGKKKWYLGYWESRNPMDLLYFDGMDTTIPTARAGVYGEIFLDFNTRKSHAHLNLYTEEIIELNTLNLKVALRELQHKGIMTRLTKYTEDPPE